jgi:hypothetical protein
MTTDQRLERLERQNWWMKVAVASMAVVLAVVFLIAAGQDEEKDKPKVLEEVRAKRFVAVDESGRETVVIGSLCPPWVPELDREKGVEKLDGIHVNGRDPRNSIRILADAPEGPEISLKGTRGNIGLVVDDSCASVTARAGDGAAVSLDADHLVGHVTVWSNDGRTSVSLRGRVGGLPPTLTRDEVSENRKAVVRSVGLKIENNAVSTFVETFEEGKK